jgi:sugar phosphate isomerase/epimerase
MQHLTLGYLTLNAPPDETITAAAKAGFKSVGIRITGRRISDPYTQVTGNKAMISELRKRVSDNGLHLSNISGYHMYGDVEWSHMKSVVDTTAELGSKIIVANCYIPPEGKTLELFSRYCEYAGKAGIRIAVEFMRYTQVKTIEMANEMVKQSGQANAGFLIDPLHLNRSGGTPAAIKKVDPKRIIFVQLCDAKLRTDNPSDQDLMSEARTARLPPGDGDLPLYDFLDALPPDTEIEFEVPRPEEVGMPLPERAKIAADRFHNYLAAYAKARGKKDPWPGA